MRSVLQISAGDAIRPARAAAFAAILLLATASAIAQNARVYVANSSNSRILRVEFNPPSTTVVIDDANRLTQVRDIAIRDDGLGGINLIACDRNGGRVVFYQNAFGSGQVIFESGTPGPERPDGLSLDLAGNLFVMNSGQGSSGGASQVWAAKRDPDCPDPQREECLAGGYRAPLGLIDADVQIATEISGGPAFIDADNLPESLVALSSAGVIQAGDLLVLTNPGALIRYPAEDVAAFLGELAVGGTPAELAPETIIHPANSSVAADMRFPAGATPNGMAFAPNGDLLIPVSDGRILIYGPNGRRRSNGVGGYVDFYGGIGQDDFKIAVGLQDGSYRAYVTKQQGGELRRFTINPDGTGTQDVVLDDFQFPVGVDATTSNTVPAPAGDNVNVTATSILASQIEKVLVAGEVNARVSTFVDPREAEQSIPANQPLHRPLYLNELRSDLPPIEVPAFARAFRFDNPDAGVPTFILIEAENSASLSGLVDHLADESSIFGYEPNCADPEVTKQPFMFWSPDADDPPIVEGAVFIDITTGCGTIRGLSRSMSYFLVGVRITTPMRSLAASKLNSLQSVIEGGACIERRTKRKLESLITRALRDFGRNNLPSVRDSLTQIDDLVEKTPQAFSGCAVNLAGEIQARVRTTLFTMTKIQ